MLLENDIITDAKQYVSYLLLPLEDYYYHHYEHALDVMERAVYLWGKEGANEIEKEILALAGLFHDTGFVIQYDKNEYIGAKIARNYLKTILYPEDRIAQIEALIIATIPSKKPDFIPKLKQKKEKSKKRKTLKNSGSHSIMVT